MKQLCCVFLVCLLGCAKTFAVEDVNQFPNTLMETRYHALIEDLRCPKCQNQNLADSNAMIAEDLRKEVKTLLLEGKTDREIEDYLIQRYGEFVLYKPRLTAATKLLWYLPVGLFLFGAGVLVMVVFQRRKPKQKVSLSLEDEQRLQALLANQQKEPK